jgi:CheY-like chemotaxis protein
MATPRTAARILLVEDNPDDIDLTVEAFRESGSSHQLFVVENGVEALDFLQRKHSFTEVPVPDLILLDLNLPKKSGHEVLAAIKTDPLLRAIPVVVLTSSAAELDEKRSYELEANGYVTKPADLGDFLRLVRIIDGFCSGMVARQCPV